MVLLVNQGNFVKFTFLPQGRNVQNVQPSAICRVYFEEEQVDDVVSDSMSSVEDCFNSAFSDKDKNRSDFTDLMQASESYQSSGASSSISANVRGSLSSRPKESRGYRDCKGIPKA